MAHLNQYLLITAMVFASCTIMLVHVFVFPLYDTKMTKNHMKSVGDFEQSLCMTNTRRISKARRHKCPAEGIVTVAQGGRLGNQIWEYASVWGVSRVTGLVPYVPRCIRSVLDAVFVRLSVQPLYKVAHCTVQWNTGSLDTWNGTSILLPRFVVMPDLVLTWVSDIRKEFKFKPKLYENSQNILRNFGNNIIYSKYYSRIQLNNKILEKSKHKNYTRYHNVDTITKTNGKFTVNAIDNSSVAKSSKSNAKRNKRQNISGRNKSVISLDDYNFTYVGVHVRRTDYKGYLWRTRKMNLADAAYFHRAMNYFRNKYKNVAFLIVSDESAWCHEHLSGSDVFVVRSRISSPGLDLALMASCNHSIIDYGTFGVWGAILAGGETVLYNISRHSSVRVAQLLPDWHVMN